MNAGRRCRSIRDPVVQWSTFCVHGEYTRRGGHCKEGRREEWSRGDEELIRVCQTQDKATLSSYRVHETHLIYQPDLGPDSAIGPMKNALLRHVYLKPGKGARMNSHLATWNKVWVEMRETFDEIAGTGAYGRYLEDLDGIVDRIVEERFIAPPSPCRSRAPGHTPSHAGPGAVYARPALR